MGVSRAGTREQANDWALVIGGLALSGSPVKLRAVDAPARTAQVVAEVPPRPVAVAAQEPVDAYVVKRVLDVPEPLRNGAYYWDTEGVPEGPIVITVDLVAQTLSIFRAGYEIGTAAVIYGADEKPTPLGVFTVTQKDAHHVSNLYGAPMPYMLRLTNDGVSIHGSALMDGKYATHGCVGVPTAFAKLIFGRVGVGDRVIVTSGEMLERGGRITAA
ncbi:L,D-transpeptidase family protein [Sphingomonas faeni]|uniref:L,D-transpeptidase family protein n=1 Tax=Sphingomonas faeni TaxID=185950 RepID=UPI00277D1C1A|nr:L,D-transpeptidase family protein [Sphingomonas faeni]MDQ0839456.1 lipoprotein-anchoring transpeptidase ErfK/SrfK [Sphingomonas faeni]